MLIFHLEAWRVSIGRKEAKGRDKGYRGDVSLQTEEEEDSG